MSHAAPPPRPRGLAGTGVTVLVLLLVVGGGAWWVHQDQRAADRDRPVGAGDSAAASASGSRAPEGSGRGSGGGDGRPRVVVVSIDGLGSAYVSRGATPVLARLLGEGAGTLNARTAVELTVTLPNHTGMVTGRPVDPAAGGHGVTWNDDDPRTVRPGVASVFTVVDAAGGSSAVLVGKTKFEMWGRSWPGTIDDLVIETDQDTLVQQAVGTIRAGEHDLTFLHLGAPDAAGHRAGWGGDAYRRAVRASDRDLGEVVAAVADAPGDGTVLVVTADHGGVPGTEAHGAASAPANYTVPFVVWGAGIAPADLYRVNPDLADPGTGRPAYDGPQPVRNGDVANLVTDLLGLRPVPGSTFDAGHDLDVTRR